MIFFVDVIRIFFPFYDLIKRMCISSCFDAIVKMCHMILCVRYACELGFTFIFVRSIFDDRRHPSSSQSRYPRHTSSLSSSTSCYIFIKYCIKIYVIEGPRRMNQSLIINHSHHTSYIIKEYSANLKSKIKSTKFKKYFLVFHINITCKHLGIHPNPTKTNTMNTVRNLSCVLLIVLNLATIAFSFQSSSAFLGHTNTLSTSIRRQNNNNNGLKMFFGAAKDDGSPGDYICKDCGYVFTKGPAAWAKLDDKYGCPPCGAPKFRFKKVCNMLENIFKSSITYYHYLTHNITFTYI